MSSKAKILVFILTYNAEKHIELVLDRIDNTLFNRDNYSLDIIIIDDMSKDKTVDICNNYKNKKEKNITVMCNPVNQGYGGNQKIGYTYAIQNGYDVVIMLHGDGQYAPEYLEAIFMPIIVDNADAVFGSRMLIKDLAIKGGMPLYKFLGNRVLTKMQNMILGTNLSEFHTGYRAYSTKALKAIPFQYNSNDFDFDTDIIIQLVDNKNKIKEVPIPTHYGEEVCHVNGVKYAIQISWSTIISRVQKFGIFYTPKFDYKLGVKEYYDKTNFDSSDTFAINQIQQPSTVLDFSGRTYVTDKIREKGSSVYQYVYKDKEQSNFESFCKLSDLEFSPDYILLLDIIERLDNPEEFLDKLRNKFAAGSPKVIIAVSNVAFFVVRFMLLLGQFNYNKRGILDMSHKRLFTFGSLCKLLENQGYRIEIIKGIPVPMNFITDNNRVSKILFIINNYAIKICKGLFSFQIGIVAKPRPTLDNLLTYAQMKVKN